MCVRACMFMCVRALVGVVVKGCGCGVVVSVGTLVFFLGTVPLHRGARGV